MIRALSILFIAGWLSLVGATLAAAESGLRFNHSESVPKGFYWITGAEPRVGDYVAICLPDGPALHAAQRRGYVPRGRCPGGHAELIKVLAADDGDHVAVQPGGVRINGGLWPASQPLAADGAGRALPQMLGLDRQLSPDEVLVLSERCDGGFDSRYFGPLNRGAIAGFAAPLLVWTDR